MGMGCPYNRACLRVKCSNLRGLVRGRFIEVEEKKTKTNLNCIGFWGFLSVGIFSEANADLKSHKTRMCIPYISYFSYLTSDIVCNFFHMISALTGWWFLRSDWLRIPSSSSDWSRFWGELEAGRWCVLHIGHSEH